MGEGRHYYLGSCVDNNVLKASLARLAEMAGLATDYLPKGVRVRERGNVIFVFNYGASSVFYAPENAQLVVGHKTVDAAGIAIWQKI